MKGYFVGTFTGGQRALAGFFSAVGKVIDTANPLSSTSKADLDEWARESAELGNMWKAAITGQPVIDATTKLGDTPLRAPAITAPDSLVKGTNFWSNTPQFIRSFLAGSINAFGSAHRFTGRLIQTVDELFKTVAFEQKMMSDAYADFKPGQGETLQDIVSRLRSDMPAVRRAQAFAQEQTFQKNLPGAMQKIEAAIRDLPFGWTIVPFIRTPWNIAAKSIRLTGATPLYEAIKRGGKDRDKALGQLALGFGFTSTAMFLALSGQLRGSGSGKNSEELRGVKPYSIKVGDTWYQFNRLDPFGMVLGLVADGVDGFEDMDSSPEADHPSVQIIGVAAVAFAQNLTSKTWMKGVNDFFSLITEKDDSTAISRLERWMAGVGRNLMPLAGSNLERRAVSGMDEFARYAFTLHEQLQQAGTLGLFGDRQDLGIRRDALGRPIKESLGLTTVVQTSKSSDRYLCHRHCNTDPLAAT